LIVQSTQSSEFTAKFDSDPLKLEAAMFEKTIEHGCCFVPGSWFEVIEKNG
jgi:aromatic amino acid aminotransferase I